MRIRRVAKTQERAAQERFETLSREPEPFSTLQKRVEALVARVHKGSVNAAAHATGVPLGTMQRIHNGTSANPRADALRRIASYYGVGIEWLLTGVGPLPAVLQPNAYSGALATDWWAALEELRLPKGIVEKVRELPNIGFDFQRWCIEGPPQFGRESIFEAMWEEAVDNDYRAWIGRVDALILAYGHDTTREMFIRHFELIERRLTADPDIEASQARAAEREVALGSAEAAEATRRTRDILTESAHEFTARELEREKAAIALAADPPAAAETPRAVVHAKAALARARRLGIRALATEQSRAIDPPAKGKPIKAETLHSRRKRKR